MVVKIINHELSPVSLNLKTEPYPYFFIDEFLEPEFFGNLVNDFYRLQDKLSFVKDPAELWRNDEARGAVQILGGSTSGDSFEKMAPLITHSSAWNELLGLISSQDFFTQLMGVFEDTLHYKERIGSKNIKLRPGDYHRSIYDALVNFDCYINVKISKSENNAGLLQHQDHASKVLALLLNLDDKEFDTRLSGGTQIWSNIKNPKLKSWSEYELTSRERGELTLVEDIKYKTNRLVGFLKTDNSWHGVFPILAPPGVTRNTLQINVMKCHKASPLLSWTNKIRSSLVNR